VTERPSQQCLQLPQSTKSWAQALAKGKSPAQIGAYVRGLAEYDEKTGAMPENADFVRWFAENGRGYCIHFASTAVVLLRAAGIPARLATGYVVTVQAGLRKTVTGSDAHAWAEYWDGQRWRILEATPTIEAAAAPPIPAKKESRNVSGWWLLLLLPLALCGKKRKEAPRIKELRQKAAFSRDGLREEEKAELERLRQIPLHILFFLRKAKRERKCLAVKQEEKKPIPWEVADPKPPVIQSGKMENRKQH
jgi:hypothetical protein